MKLKKFIFKRVNVIEDKPLFVVKTGLRFALSLLISALVLTLIKQNYGDWILMNNYITGMLEAALACILVGEVFGIAADAAMKDIKGKL